MLSKDPAHRWPSLVEARERLGVLAAGGTSGEVAAVDGTARDRSGSMVRSLVLGAVVVLLAAVVVWATR